MTKQKKLTRKEKSEINKANWSDGIMKARAFTKYERESIANSLRAAEGIEPQDKFIEAIKLGLNMVESARAATIGLDKIYKLIDEDEEYKKTYTHARDIANNNKAEFLEVMNEEEPREIYDAQGNKIYDKTELEWRKAREANTRWLLSIRDPKRFGNNSRLQAELTGKDGSALGQTIVVTEKELEEARKRIENESEN